MAIRHVDMTQGAEGEGDSKHAKKKASSSNKAFKAAQKGKPLDEAAVFDAYADEGYLDLKALGKAVRATRAASARRSKRPRPRCTRAPAPSAPRRARAPRARASCFSCVWTSPVAARARPFTTGGSRALLQVRRELGRFHRPRGVGADPARERRRARARGRRPARRAPDEGRRARRGDGRLLDARQVPRARRALPRAPRRRALLRLARASSRGGPPPPFQVVLFMQNDAGKDAASIGASRIRGPRARTRRVSRESLSARAPPPAALARRRARCRACSASTPTPTRRSRRSATSPTG